MSNKQRFRGLLAGGTILNTQSVCGLILLGACWSPPTLEVRQAVMQGLEGDRGGEGEDLQDMAGTGSSLWGQPE